MKQQDVGPVLVVSDYNTNHLVGIVTDRDIAVNVVAEGRDPYSTRVDSVMTEDLMTCTEGDDVMEAVKIMAEYQVRRVPVVDENGCVLGIIAQADIARNTDEEQVGEMVEEISQPWGMGEWPNSGESRQGNGGGRSHSSRGLDPVSALAVGALCAGFGAGIMYLFDPNRGRRRRAQLQERSTEMWNQRGELVHRAHDMIETAKSRVTGGGTTTASEQRPGGSTSAVESDLAL